MNLILAANSCKWGFEVGCGFCGHGTLCAEGSCSGGWGRAVSVDEWVGQEQGSKLFFMSVESVSIEQGIVPYWGFGKIGGEEVGRRRRLVYGVKES